MGVFPRAPITNGITLSFMFYMFLNSRAKFWWCSVFSDSLVCTLSSKIYYLEKLFIFLWYLVCSHTFPDTFEMWSPIVSYIYYFPLLPPACASTTFLSLLSHIFQWIFISNQWCHLLYSFWANLLHLLNTLFTLSSFFTHSTFIIFLGLINLCFYVIGSYCLSLCGHH